MQATTTSAKATKAQRAVVTKGIKDILDGATTADAVLADLDSIPSESLGPVVNADGTPTAVTVAMLTGAGLAEVEAFDAALAAVGGASTPEGQALMEAANKARAKAKRGPVAEPKAKVAKATSGNGVHHLITLIDRPKADGVALVRSGHGWAKATKAGLSPQVCGTCGYGPTAAQAARLAAGAEVGHFAAALAEGAPVVSAAKAKAPAVKRVKVVKVAKEADPNPLRKHIAKAAPKPATGPVARTKPVNGATKAEAAVVAA